MSFQPPPIVSVVGRVLLWVFGIFTGGLTLLLGLFYLFFQPGQSGLLHNLTLPDGTELRLIQRETDFLYSIDFYLKRPGEKWGWCFVDKEEPSWCGGGKLHWDAERQVVGVFRGGQCLAEYSPAQRTFTVFRMYQPVRPAPQVEQEPPY